MPENIDHEYFINNFCDFENQSSFVSMTSKTRRIAVFYPLSDYHNPTSGASIRVNNMVRILSNDVEEIRIMQRWNKQELSDGKVNLLSVKVDENTFILKIFQRLFCLIFYKILAKNQKEEATFLLRFIEPFLYKELKKSINELVNWSDAVIIEFPFWAHIITRACKRKKIPVILTTHDFVADHIHNNKLIRVLVRFMELSSLKKVNHVIAVTHKDAIKFKKYGINTVVIENKVDCLYWAQEFPFNPRSYLENNGINLPKGNLCLFVGGGHYPNLEAVAYIKKIAVSLLGKFDVTFIIVGNCAQPEIQSNLISLGKVDQDVILALYNVVDLVLVPLKSGSGSSIKTIEAMAAGCAVLGTSVGFRGLDIINNYHAFVDDNIGKYNEIIVKILLDKEKCIVVRDNAKKWSINSDFRKEFNKYLSLLNIHYKV